MIFFSLNKRKIGTKSQSLKGVFQKFLKASKRRMQNPILDLSWSFPRK